MKKHMNLIDMYRSIGMIPASYKVAMTYEEQLLWLCNYIQEVATGTEDFEARVSALEQEMPLKQDLLTAGYQVKLENNIIWVEGETLKPYDWAWKIIPDYYLDIGNLSVGDTADLTPVSSINTGYIIKDVVAGEKFKLKGNFTCATLNAQNKVTYIDTKTIEEDGEWYVTCDPEDTKFIVSFWNTNVYTPYLEEIVNSWYLVNIIQKLLNSGGGGGSAEVTKLTSQLVLNGTCDLPTGLYTTDSYNVYLGSATLENLILGTYQLFYFDNDSQTLTSGIASYYYDSGSWYIMEHNYITNEINDNRSQIPTSQAVNRFSWQFENFDKILANRLTTYINQYDELVQNTIYDIENAIVGEIYTPSTSVSTNEASISDSIVLGEQYSITGDFEYVLCDTTGKVLIKESGTGTALDPFYISPLHRRLTDQDYMIYINLTNTQDPYSIYKAIFVEPIEKVYSTSKSYQIPNAKDMFENLDGNRTFTKNVGLKLSTNYTYVHSKWSDFNSGYKYDFSGYSIGDTFNPVNVSEAGAGNISVSVKLCEYLAFGENGVIYNYAICDLNNVILDFGTITGTTIPTILSPINEGYEQDLIFYIWTPSYSSRELGVGELLIPSRNLEINNDHLHFPSNYAVKTYVDDSINNFRYAIAGLDQNHSSITIPASWTNADLPIDEIIEQNGNYFSVANNKITCLFNGIIELYFIVVPGGMASANTYNIKIMKNNSSIGGVEIKGLQGFSFQRSYILNVQNGDEFSLACSSSAGSSQTLSVSQSNEFINIKVLKVNS